MNAIYSYQEVGHFDLLSLGNQVSGLGLAAYLGVSSVISGRIDVEFLPGTILSDADKARLDGTIAAYVYQAPPPPPDVPGFLRALHQDSALTDAKLGAILGDWRGQICVQAIGVGDFAHAQTLYGQLKATPPTGATAADVTEIGNVAQANHLPITP